MYVCCHRSPYKKSESTIACLTSSSSSSSASSVLKLPSPDPFSSSSSSSFFSSYHQSSSYHSHPTMKRKMSSPPSPSLSSSSSSHDHDNEQQHHHHHHHHHHHPHKRPARVTILHVCPPVVVRVHPHDFQLTVQKLTGLQRILSPAAAHVCEHLSSSTATTTTTTTASSLPDEPELNSQPHLDSLSLDYYDWSSDIDDPHQAACTDAPEIDPHAFDAFTLHPFSKFDMTSSPVDPFRAAAHDRFQYSTMDLISSKGPTHSLADLDMSSILDCYCPSLDHIQSELTAS